MLLLSGIVLFTLFCVNPELEAYEQRPDLYALVIGNNAYPISPLRNAVNDARAIAGQLARQGFNVTAVYDVGSDELRRTIGAFYAGIDRQADGRAVGLVYYAGHAVQINHRNYLVPLDIEFGEPGRFLEGLFDINQLLVSIPESAQLQSIIILDACRENPFEGVGGIDGHAKINDGLAPVRAPVGTLIAYSTEPGTTASDGTGKNGVYASHLLRHMDEKIPIEEVFKKVRKGVAGETGNRQVPWEHSSLLEDVFINSPPNREIPELMAF